MSRTEPEREKLTAKAISATTAAMFDAANHGLARTTRNPAGITAAIASNRAAARFDATARAQRDDDEHDAECHDRVGCTAVYAEVERDTGAQCESNESDRRRVNRSRSRRPHCPRR